MMHRITKTCEVLHVERGHTYWHARWYVRGAWCGGWAMVTSHATGVTHLSWAKYLAAEIVTQSPVWQRRWELQRQLSR